MMRPTAITNGFHPLRSMHGGYFLLISIILIGAIAASILSSLFMLGISAGQLVTSVAQSKQAFGIVQGCAEEALLKLHNDPTYSGNESFVIGGGTCDVLTVGGIGNNNRSLCLEGVNGDTVRRIEIVINQVLPKTTIYSWQEVSSFTLCQ